MAFATADYTGQVLAPGEGLVVDNGAGGRDEIYRFSAATPDGAVLLHSDADGEGPLIRALDITIGATGVFIADSPKAEPGCIWRLGDDGSLTPVATDDPIASPMGIATDPITGDLFVADAHLKQLLRVNPETGATARVVTGLSGVASAGVDVTPDGSRIFVTDGASDAIFTFTRTEED